MEFKVIFGFAAVILVALEVISAVFPMSKRRILPIGGSSLAQMAIVFGTAFVFAESLSLIGIAK